MEILSIIALVSGFIIVTVSIVCFIMLTVCIVSDKYIPGIILYAIGWIFLISVFLLGLIEKNII